MEIDPKATSRIWWKGAITSAIKGIPQGLLLGTLAAGVLIGGLYLMAGIGMASTAGYLGYCFNTFLFNMSAPAVHTALGSVVGAHLPAITGLSVFFPLPIIGLNTVLTSIGNFLSGGTMAVNAYKQQIDHDANVTRLERLEGRELQLEQTMPLRSPNVQKILSAGPRSVVSFKDAEETRAAQAPTSPTIH